MGVCGRLGLGQPLRQAAGVRGPRGCRVELASSTLQQAKTRTGEDSDRRGLGQKRTRTGVAAAVGLGPAVRGRLGRAVSRVPQRIRVPSRMAGMIRSYMGMVRSYIGLVRTYMGSSGGQDGLSEPGPDTVDGRPAAGCDPAEPEGARRTRMRMGRHLKCDYGRSPESEDDKELPAAGTAAGRSGIGHDSEVVMTRKWHEPGATCPLAGLGLDGACVETHDPSMGREGVLTIKWVRMTRMSHGAITKMSHHQATKSLQGSQMIR